VCRKKDPNHPMDGMTHVVTLLAIIFNIVTKRKC
jgi:hypothetical protein